MADPDMPTPDEPVQAASAPATPKKAAVKKATAKKAAARKATPKKAAPKKTAAKKAAPAKAAKKATLRKSTPKKAAPVAAAAVVDALPAADVSAFVDESVTVVAPGNSSSQAVAAATATSASATASDSQATAAPAASSTKRATADEHISMKDQAWRARLAQPVHPPTRAEKLLYWFVHLILVRGLSRLWFRLEVVDRDWVPTHGPFVVAPVHRSNIDFFLVAAITKTRMRYIGKDTLWKFGPLGRFIGMLGAFPVRRGAADREALRTCIQVIENGEPLVIFPEGTRQSGPTVQNVFDGPAYIAARTGVPVVPVGIGGTERAMPKGAKWIRPRKVVLVVGEPLEPPKGDGTGRAPRRAVRELTEQLKTDIQALFDEAQQRAG